MGFLSFFWMACVPPCLPCHYTVMAAVGDEDVSFGVALLDATAPSASTDAAITTSEATAAAAAAAETWFPILGNESVSIETAEASAL